MKTIILYLSKNHHTDAYPVYANGIKFYVRAELVEADLVTALDEAKPREGESVINTIPLSKLEGRQG